MKRDLIKLIDLADDLLMTIKSIRRIKTIMGEQICDDTTDYLTDTLDKVLSSLYEITFELKE